MRLKSLQFELNKLMLHFMSNFVTFCGVTAQELCTPGIVLKETIACRTGGSALIQRERSSSRKTNQRFFVFSRFACAVIYRIPTPLMHLF